MPMSARLLRPRSTGFHPEAQAWRNRVITNGGTVSGSTLTAVSNFCRSIDAAGIRDRFYRLNLFCGTGLSAALVPLYRGQSRTGTQFGGTTDANNGMVSGDYNETGTSAGFIGGTNKYLNTGLAANVLPQTDRHLSVVLNADALGGGSQYAIGADNFGSGGNFYWGIIRAATAGNAGFRASTSSANSSNIPVTGRPHIVVSGNGSASSYLNGAASVTMSLTAFTAAALDVWVVGLNRGGTLGDIYQGRVSAYSIGLSMTASQASSFYTAMNSFQSAMNRL